jgi:hypothetical protein
MRVLGGHGWLTMLKKPGHPLWGEGDEKEKKKVHGGVASSHCTAPFI